MASKKIEMLYLPFDPFIINKTNLDFIICECKKRKMPVFTYSEEFVKAGAFASLAPDYSNIGAQAALLSKKILIDKFSPNTLKINALIGAQFVINFNTVSDIIQNSEPLKAIVNKIYY